MEVAIFMSNIEYKIYIYMVNMGILTLTQDTINDVTNTHILYASTVALNASV